MEPRCTSNQWYEKVELLEHLQEKANNTSKTKGEKPVDPTALQIFPQDLLALKN